MARFGDGFLNGLAKRSVSGGVVEHVQIRRRGEEGLVEIMGEAFVSVVVVFDDDPFRVTRYWVKLELEHALGGRAHGSNGG